ncbi:hypothetical protein H4R27_000425 [Coemansia aciculifera]|nr:hypothetical protein H4R27_000425 [Coemansia aciculifera]
MSTFSPFQFLPPHIVRLIVDHVTGSSRVVFDGVCANSHEYGFLLKPLLWVCHNFRAVAYSRYCNNFELNLSSLSFGDLDKHHSLVCRTDVNYRTLNHLGYPTHHLARDITVFMDERTVYSGEALGMVSRAPYDGCSFPLARMLAFIFVKDTADRVDEDIWNDPPIVGTNIGAFVKRIKQMAPSVGGIRVKAANRGSMPGIANQYFGDLASRFYQLASRVEYNYHCYTEDSTRLQLDMISNLTHISYTSDSSIGNVNQFIQLARQNALTLQSLIFECEEDLDVLGLVQDAEGNHVAYPHLLTLKLWAVSIFDELEQPVFHGAAPFPIIQQLRIECDRPFADDTFFRGNAATLEWLDVRLDRLSAPMLRRFKVFAPGSHPRLRVVKLQYTDDFGSELFASPADALQFMYSIGLGVAVQEYSQTSIPANPELAFSPLGSHACIQVLSLPTLHPDLWQIISLIKSLPLLSDLHTSFPCLGPIPDGVDLDELPEHIISNHAPIGRIFRCWHLNKYFVTNFTDLTVCVLLLALVCPNFDYAATSSYERKWFMEMLEKDIDSDRFKPYAPRLRRLLFNGWDEKQD